MSNALAAIALINDVLALMVNGSEALRSINATLQQAQAEGRDVTDAELDALRAARLQVVSDMQAEIARRQAAGES